MTFKGKLLVAAPLAAALLAAPVVAHADWHGRGDWHRGFVYRAPYRGGPHWGPGAVIGGALLGLGAGALVAGALAPPPAYYPPPPVYYAPPPAYYSAPPAYYPPPGY